MPATTPMPTKNPGDVLTSTLWNTYLRDNIDKLLTRGHRVLTVAQFAALSSPEGTKGTVAPDEVYVEIDATNGIVWHLHYESTDASTSKWRFIGGPALFSEVVTFESTASTTYVALATGGPSIPLPRLGDYDVVIGSTINNATNASDNLMSYDIGATGALDADGIQLTQPVTNNNALTALSRPRRKTGLTAVTLTSKYRVGSGSGTFRYRWMAVTPTRIG